jgi:hypothetical protein
MIGHMNGLALTILVGQLPKLRWLPKVPAVRGPDHDGASVFRAAIILSG